MFPPEASAKAAAVVGQSCENPPKAGRKNSRPEPSIQPATRGNRARAGPWCPFWEAFRCEAVSRVQDNPTAQPSAKLLKAVLKVGFLLGSRLCKERALGKSCKPPEHRLRKKAMKPNPFKNPFQQAATWCASSLHSKIKATHKKRKRKRERERERARERERKGERKRERENERERERARKRAMTYSHKQQLSKQQTTHRQRDNQAGTKPTKPNQLNPTKQNKTNQTHKQTNTNKQTNWQTSTQDNEQAHKHTNTQTQTQTPISASGKRQKRKEKKRAHIHTQQC